MKNLSIFGLLGAVVLLNGCAVHYSCVGVEGQNRGCESVSMVAKKTEHSLPVDEEENKATLKTHKQAIINAAAHAYIVPTALAQVNVGDPILTTPKTMRIFFAPYKDDQGDLNTGGYVYMEVTPSEWVLAK
jgi:type IV conjugative transfer system lipoprotein TraV